jgi:dimethylhistidine N-methyltransferase
MGTVSTAVPVLDELALEVRAGLGASGQKSLPCKYFYDEVGSALFEVISLLPEYGLSRADDRLLRRHAPDIVRRVPPAVTVVELGSGNGKKTRDLLGALARRRPVTYCPIEISGAALARCAQELSGVDAIRIVAHQASYLEGLKAAAARRPAGESLLVLFLGSTIGNFDRASGEAFLAHVRALLHAGDALLLGTDLEQSRDRLLRAYDDPAGVTAAFNLNLLARLNRELAADFVLPRFAHLALWNERERRIEMHLRSRQDQRVQVARAGLAVTLREGETIWTENSHKYTAGEVVAMAERTGFRCEAQWLDAEWPFAESLLLAC